MVRHPLAIHPSPLSSWYDGTIFVPAATMAAGPTVAPLQGLSTEWCPPRPLVVLDGSFGPKDYLFFETACVRLHFLRNILGICRTIPSLGIFVSDACISSLYDRLVHPRTT